MLRRENFRTLVSALGVFVLIIGTITFMVVLVKWYANPSMAVDSKFIGCYGLMLMFGGMVIALIPWWKFLPPE